MMIRGIGSPCSSSEWCEGDVLFGERSGDKLVQSVTSSPDMRDNAVRTLRHATTMPARSLGGMVNEGIGRARVVLQRDLQNALGGRELLPFRLKAREPRLLRARNFLQECITLGRFGEIDTLLQELKAPSTALGLAEVTGLLLCGFLNAVAQGMYHGLPRPRPKTTSLRDTCLRLQMGLLRQHGAEPFQVIIDACFVGMKVGFESASAFDMRAGLEQSLEGSLLTASIGPSEQTFVEHLYCMLFYLT